MADFPSGIIVLWHGTILTIPTGWLLCDGNNGTPNLKNKFPIGAGGLFNPGDTGGSPTHTHPFTGNSHSHLIPAGTDISSGANFAAGTSSVPPTGTTDAADTRPPYHALAYIMKT